MSIGPYIQTPLGGHAVRGVTRAPARRAARRWVRVTINVAELLRWCAANGTVPDGPARAAFGVLVAERRSRAN